MNSSFRAASRGRNVEPVPDPIDELAEWLATARAGSPEALGRVLELCRRYLLEIASSELDTLLQPKVGASDMVQETFLEAQRIFDRFQGVSPVELRAWLRAILLNKIGTFTRQYRDTAKRRIGREVGIDGDSEVIREPASPTVSPSSMVTREEQAALLRAALDRLPEHYRQIIVWRQMDGLEFEEMAARLGKSLDAVRKLWWRAIQQLQEELRGTQ